MLRNLRLASRFQPPMTTAPVSASTLTPTGLFWGATVGPDRRQPTQALGAQVFQLGVGEYHLATLLRDEPARPYLSWKRTGAVVSTRPNSLGVGYRARRLEKADGYLNRQFAHEASLRLAPIWAPSRIGGGATCPPGREARWPTRLPA